MQKSQDIIEEEKAENKQNEEVKLIAETEQEEKKEEPSTPASSDKTFRSKEAVPTGKSTVIQKRASSSEFRNVSPSQQKQMPASAVMSKRPNYLNHNPPKVTIPSRIDSNGTFGRPKVIVGATIKASQV